MAKCNKTIYPLPAEITREIAVIMDTKSIAVVDEGDNIRQLDDACENIYLERDQIDKLINNYIIQPIRERVSENLAAKLDEYLFEFFNKYLYFVARQQPPFTRSNTIHFLFQELWASSLVHLIRELMTGKDPGAKDFILGKSLEKGSISLLTDLRASSSCAFIIECLKQNNLWPEVSSQKEADNYSRMTNKWENGILPSLGSLTRIFIKGEEALELMFIARATDEFRRRHYDFFSHLIELVVNEKIKPAKFVDNSGVVPLYNKMTTTYNTLISNKNKSRELQESIKKDIDSYAADERNSNQPQIRAEAMRLRAMYHLFNGDRIASLKEMKKCVDHWLFNNKVSDNFFTQALQIGSIQDNPDKAFLKNVRKAQVLFGFAQATNQDKDKANDYASHIQDWQIEDWRKLPDPNLLFPGIAQYDIKINRPTAPLVIDSKEKIKYRHSNQKTKLGDSAIKNIKTTPLIHYVRYQDYVKIQQLLNKGADVNILSSNNDSAINCALMSLSPTATGIKSIGTARKIVDLLLSEPYGSQHKTETINTSTEKLKYMPLHSAIDACEPYYVEKLLELGAESSAKATVYELSSLYYCAGSFALCKMPESEIKANIIKSAGKPITLLEKDIAHRYGNDLFGFDVINIPVYIKKLVMIVEHIAQKVRELYSIEKFCMIAEMLLKYDLDNNRRYNHRSKKQRTSLMHATENKEVELLKLMLQNNGDISHACHQDHYNAAMISAQRIVYIMAQRCRATATLTSLKLPQDSANV